MRSDRLLVIAAIVSLALFTAVLITLLEARLQSGDIYPVYSSMRSDSAGTKAYYESIGKLEGVSSQRLHEPLKDFRGNNATIFVLGITPASAFQEYARLARAGNRVVIGLPVCSTAAPAKTAPEKLGIAWHCIDGGGASRDRYVLTDPGTAWRVIGWDIDGSPVAAERIHENGSIVLVADTYLLTNEALLQDRNVELLTALLGRSRNVFFDEHHLGIAEQYGVVSLARKYRLQGFTAGLLLIATLFIWRNSTSFLPRAEDAASEDEVFGRAVSSGLTNLLGRSIPRSELLQVCVAEWKRSVRGRASDEDIERVAQLARNNEPVESYRRITQLLSERRRK